MTTVFELIRLMRPHQWLKNAFVFAGLLFGHVEQLAYTLPPVLLAFAAFSLMASAIYIGNDLCDREQDRNHPVKRHRPLAAGTISAGAALIAGTALAAGALAAAWLASPEVLVLVGIYAAINAAYSLGLKHVVILDVFIVAAGFMLRLLAGTVGVGIPPSQWLLVCGLMVALFLGFCKRRFEIAVVGDNGAGAHRRVLESYTPAMLDALIVITAASTVVTYSLYTLSPETAHIHGTDTMIYTVPFVLYGVFRYLLRVRQGSGGGDPARDLISDPHTLAAAVAWLGVTVWLIK